MYTILSKYLQTQVSLQHQPSKPVILAMAVVIVPCNVLFRNNVYFTITFVLPREVCVAFPCHLSPYANTRAKKKRIQMDTHARHI